MPVEFRRSIHPPYRSAFAEFPFGHVNRTMSRGFSSLVVRKLGRPDCIAGRHQFAYHRGSLLRGKVWICEPPQPAAEDEVPPVRRYGMLEAGHQMNGFPPVTAMVVPDV